MSMWERLRKKHCHETADGVAIIECDQQERREESFYKFNYLFIPLI